MPFAPIAALLSTENVTQLIPSVVLAALYTKRVRTLARPVRGGAGQETSAGPAHPVPGWRQACFYSGLALILIALISPIGDLADEILYMHMIEHLMIGELASLLLVLGLTGPLLAPVLRIRVFDRLRVLSNPLIAFPLWMADFYVWHLPVFYQAAIEHLPVHILEHTMFIAFGMNMWMCLFGPLPKPQWFGNLPKLLYILAVRFSGAVLGNIFLWSGTVFYPVYVNPDAARHISPLTDQRMAGGVMMTIESLLTLGLFWWLFMRAARESEERQELLDFAEDNGLELSEQRATRAVSAGRGADLRRRLEERLPETLPGEIAES